MSCDDLVEEFKRIAAGSASWGSPSFMDFPDAGNSVPALCVCVAMLTLFINQNMANQDICSPTAAFRKIETMHRLRLNMGFKVASTYRSSTEIGGVLTLGGCLSNTLALIAARESVFPGSRITGVPALGSDIIVLVPDIIEHYSIRSAMVWLSLGEKNVLRIPIDATFRIDLKALASIIHKQYALGKPLLQFYIVNGKVAPIKKTPEYLASNEMLHRFIFNVLTVPNIHLGGSKTLILHLRAQAGDTLIKLIQNVGSYVNSAGQFALQARSHDKRSGEEHLGYKERPDVIHHLHDLWEGSQRAKQGCIIFLNGFPGVGKLTIARAIKSQLPEKTTRLIDNHSLIDLAEAITPGRSPAHKRLRAGLRRVTLESLTGEFAAQPHLKVIMTGCLGDNAEDVAVLAEHVRIAQHANAPFYLVNITCEHQEHRRRLVLASRAESGKMKLRDGTVLDQLLEQNHLYDPSMLSEQLLALVHFEHVQLDTTGLTVEQTVSKKLLHRMV